MIFKAAPSLNKMNVALRKLTEDGYKTVGIFDNPKLLLAYARAEAGKAKETASIIWPEDITDLTVEFRRYVTR